jgi:predicted anti-sigma-YlaC factor YlaD
MNCEDTTELLSDRLKGALKADDERRLQAHLEACPACRDEADAIVVLWNEMGTLDDDVPHERMRARFHAALAAYEDRNRPGSLDRLIERVWPRRPALQAGIAAVLLAMGVLVGQWLPSSMDREIAGLREEIRTIGLVLLDHQSAAERLRGVEWARRVESARAVDALLETVRYDSNLNVRLAAAEALSNWLDRPQVRAGLTDALERQDAPLMQVTLAEVLLEGNVGGSIAAVERMLERDELDPSVRDYLRAVLRQTGARAPIPEV